MHSWRQLLFITTGTAKSGTAKIFKLLYLLTTYSVVSSNSFFRLIREYSVVAVSASALCDKAVLADAGRDGTRAEERVPLRRRGFHLRVCLAVSFPHFRTLTNTRNTS